MSGTLRRASPAPRLCGRAGRRLPAAAVLVWLAAVASACGGGGGSTPTSPTAPAPTLPVSSACDALGLISGATAILNGTECAAARSAVVLLNMRDATGFGIGACSGTVITPRAILTAAHCLDPAPAVIRVWLGSGTELVADSFAGHPAYAGGSQAADVGVVFMREDLPRTPIPLLLGREARVGETAVVAGWGRDQSSVPATLRAGSTTITGVGTAFLETQFGANVSSVCSGDSGGPILLSEGGAWTIGGVTSATSENVCNTGTNFYIPLRSASVSSFVLGLVPDAGRR